MQDVFDALRTHAANRPQAAAFRDSTGMLTWGALAKRVAASAAALCDAPAVIGLALPGGIDFAVADLAVTLSGRRLVPLPFFFSAGQLAHVLDDAEVGAVIGGGDAARFGLPVISLEGPHSGTFFPDYRGGGSRVIYTSGSSGRPKGVIHGDRQLSASIAALADIVRADSTDRHLSVLPLAQLLEQICGIFLPIVAGAETVFDAAATRALFGGPIAPLAEAMAHTRPTTSLLSPSLLAGWIDILEATQRRAPDSLRFVAVGGAKTPPAILARAAACGIPVCEGYGLSECCAVVAMNPPGKARPGTVGRVLEPLDVRIIDGEITVAGPTVMEGYLGGPSAPQRWHTGDNGHFEGDRLVIDGRRDSMIVTAEGRNIAPEWVETRVTTDRRVRGAALCHLPGERLVLVVAAVTPITPSDLQSLLPDLPAYARPHAVVMVDPLSEGLFFPAGTPNRAVAAKLAAAGQPLPLFETDKVEY